MNDANDKADTVVVVVDGSGAGGGCGAVNADVDTLNGKLVGLDDSIDIGDDDMNASEL